MQVQKRGQSKKTARRGFIMEDKKGDSQKNDSIFLLDI